MSSLLSDKVSTTNSATGHPLNSTIPCRQRQNACIFDVETNHPSYKLSKIYIKDEDTNNMCHPNRISINFDSNQQEYVPIESVRHLLINDISNTQSENTGNGYIYLIDSTFSRYYKFYQIFDAMRSLYDTTFVQQNI